MWTRGRSAGPSCRAACRSASTAIGAKLEINRAVRLVKSGVRDYLSRDIPSETGVGHLFNAFKPLLSDFLSTIVLIVFLSATDNLVLSVSAAMATAVIQIAVEKWGRRPISIMQWASFALVIVLGSMSIATNSPVFAMLKPTIANAAIGCVMLVPNWQGRYLP